MNRLAPALCLLAAALLALPAAQAQALPSDPTMSVSLEVAPTSPTIPLGSTQAFNVNVIVSTNYVFCSAPGSVSVTLALSDSGLAGVAGALPSSVTVPIGANVQPPNAQTTSRGNATARLEVTVARSATPDHEHAFTITATTPAALPSGCSAISPNPPKASTASADAKLKTGPAPPSTMTGGSGGVSVTAGDCGASVSAPGVNVNASASCATKKSFFLPLPLELAILLLAGLLRRR